MAFFDFRKYLYYIFGLEFQGPMGSFKILAPAGAFLLHLFEEDGAIWELIYTLIMES